MLAILHHRFGRGTTQGKNVFLCLAQVHHGVGGTRQYNTGKSTNE